MRKLRPTKESDIISHKVGGKRTFLVAFKGSMEELESVATDTFFREL